MKKRFLLAVISGLAGIALLEGALRVQWWRLWPRHRAEIRVLVLGDSTVLSPNSPAEAVPSQLEVLLRESCPKSTILVENGGIAGARSDDVARTLHSWLMRAGNPQVVALIVGLNDLLGLGGEVTEQKISRFRVLRLGHALLSYLMSSEVPSASQAHAPLLARLSRPDYYRIVTHPLTIERRLGELEKIHRAVLNENPLQHSALLDLGNLLRATSRAAEALEVHRIAAQDAPNDPFAAFAVVADLSALQRLPEALDGTDSLVAHARTLPLPLVMSLAEFLREHGEKARLVALIHEAQKREGPQPILLWLSSNSLEWAGKPREAAVAKARALLAEKMPYPAPLTQNYRAVLSQIAEEGAVGIAVSYPRQAPAPLEEVVDSPSSILSLEQAFEPAIKKEGYHAVFRDSSGGNFGYLTSRGSAILAGELYKRLITMEPTRSLCRR